MLCLDMSDDAVCSIGHVYQIPSRVRREWRGREGCDTSYITFTCGHGLSSYLYVYAGAERINDGTHWGAS